MDGCRSKVRQETRGLPYFGRVKSFGSQAAKEGPEDTGQKITGPLRRFHEGRDLLSTTTKVSGCPNDFGHGVNAGQTTNRRSQAAHNEGQQYLRIEPQESVPS
jgi:hypothetical protein